MYKFDLGFYWEGIPDINDGSYQCISTVVLQQSLQFLPVVKVS